MKRVVRKSNRETTPHNLCMKAENSLIRTLLGVGQCCLSRTPPLLSNTTGGSLKMLSVRGLTLKADTSTGSVASLHILQPVLPEFLLATSRFGAPGSYKHKHLA